MSNPLDASLIYAQWLALLCVWREGRGESQDARRGIWWVLQNRVGKPQFRPTLVRVVLQPWQFSSFNQNDPNVTKFPNDGAALDWAAWGEILTIAQNPGTDPTSGAVYYESFSLELLEVAREKDPWFSPDKLTTQIGNVRFYKI